MMAAKKSQPVEQHSVVTELEAPLSWPKARMKKMYNRNSQSAQQLSGKKYK
jgi:hypothetical protein